jgi:hypothetical protein
MKVSYKEILITMAVIVVVCAISYWIGRRDGINKAAESLVERVDTTYIYDTITQYKPIHEEKRIIEKVYLPVEVTDTIWKHDTLLIPMEREQLVWQDSLSRVYASGILPQIDSVEHFLREIVVSKEISVPKKVKTRWGIGIQLGYGAYYDQKIHTAPYIGVGISYNILSW